MSQDLSGKTFVITGATSGIGKVTALELAKRGARVIVACRSPEKAAPVVESIRSASGNQAVEAVTLDLGSLESVRNCAAEILAKGTPIHGLINNAGLASTRGTTADGFELAFGTNHLGHYLLTRLLLDRIIASAPARIVNVSSHSHYRAKRIPWDKLQQRTPSLLGLAEYEVSKLANVLFTAELARRLAGSGVTTYALHPGVVATDVWRRMPNPLRWLATRVMITPEQGAVASLRTATDPVLAGDTGKYYDPKGVEKHPSRVAQDPALAKELWAKSAAWVGLPID